MITVFDPCFDRTSGLRFVSADQKELSLGSTKQPVNRLGSTKQPVNRSGRTKKPTTHSGSTKKPINHSGRTNRYNSIEKCGSKVSLLHFVLCNNGCCLPPGSFLGMGGYPVPLKKLGERLPASFLGIGGICSISK